MCMCACVHVCVFSSSFERTVCNAGTRCVCVLFELFAPLFVLRFLLLSGAYLARIASHRIATRGFSGRRFFTFCFRSSLRPVRDEYFIISRSLARWRSLEPGVKWNSVVCLFMVRAWSSTPPDCQRLWRCAMRHRNEPCIVPPMDLGRVASRSLP